MELISFITCLVSVFCLLVPFPFIIKRIRCLEDQVKSMQHNHDQLSAFSLKHVRDHE